jgi:hypothetical protein
LYVNPAGFVSPESVASDQWPVNANRARNHA